MIGVGGREPVADQVRAVQQPGRRRGAEPQARARHRGRRARQAAGRRRRRRRRRPAADDERNGHRGEHPQDRQGPGRGRGRGRQGARAGHRRSRPEPRHHPGREVRSRRPGGALDPDQRAKTPSRPAAARPAASTASNIPGARTATPAPATPPTPARPRRPPTTRSPRPPAPRSSSRARSSGCRWPWPSTAITTPGKGGKPGDYTPRSPEEMKRIDELVRSAVGFDQAAATRSGINVRFDRRRGRRGRRGRPRCSTSTRTT